MGPKTIPFEEVKREWLQNPEFKRIYDEMEPAYQIARLRIMSGLTQQQLAELVGTSQSSIARLESGRELPRLSFLRRVVEAMGGTVTVTITAGEQGS